MSRPWEVVKSKNFLILLLFILATCISIWLVSVPTPNFRNIMTQTHKQFKKIKHINVISPKKQEDDINVDETYLELLGFNSKGGLYPSSVDKELNVPVIVTGTLSTDIDQLYKLIESVRRHLSDRYLVIYDLGLNSVELVQLKKHCNSSMNCTVKPLDLSKFPMHVRDPHLKAYIPVTIQKALSEYGAVIWTDTREYFITNDIADVLKKAEKNGIAGWPIESEEPTSAFTHPKMFKYFKTRPDLYFFHKMIGSNHLVIYNTEVIHRKLMLLWLKCALSSVSDCIYPLGAQSRGCHSDRKPLYRYSRCHKSGMSALNVILGLIFDYDDTKYSVRQKIFGIETAADKDLVVTTKRTSLPTGPPEIS